jgi:pimeloyl-ACP methyl ester carboxylesterase
MWIAALLAILTGCLADAVLLWPPKSPPQYGELRAVIHDVDGAIETFVATSSQGNEPQAYVLCFFGNGQLADTPLAWIAESMRPLRLELWGVNYAGYGGSEGKATLEGVAHTARRAYRAIAKAANGKPVIVFGSSLGAAAALDVAAHEQVAAVVLHNPPPLRQLVLRRYGWWNLWLVALPVALQIPDELDALHTAPRVKAPAVFLSSSDDGVVPFGYQQRVMKAYGGDWELIEMRGAGHNDPIPDWAAEALVRRIARWFPDTDLMGTYQDRARRAR